MEENLNLLVGTASNPSKEVREGWALAARAASALLMNLKVCPPPPTSPRGRIILSCRAVGGASGDVGNEERPMCVCVCEGFGVGLGVQVCVQACMCLWERRLFS